MTITLDDATLSKADLAVARGLASNRSDLIQLALNEFIDSRRGSAHRLDVPWSTYFALIKNQEEETTTNGDSMWVFGRQGPSYRSEIEGCRDLLDDAGSFLALDNSARLQVAGIGPDTTGFLGRMDVSPPYKTCVRENWSSVAQLLDELPVRGPVAADLERAVLERLLGIDGIGMGGATRLMAIARPDLYFTVNGASRDGIQALLGPTRDDSPTRRVDAYLRLLDTIRKFEWFNAPKPPVAGKRSAEERFAWSARVALLDALFYAAEPNLSLLDE